MFKKSIKTIPFLFLVFLAISSCIPIEDKVGPRVNDFDIQATYFYQDTIDFSVIFTDNSGLDSGSIVIDRIPTVTPGPNAWFYLDTFDIRGRRIEPNFKIVVPEYKEVGEYILTVFGYDEGGNPDTVRRIFNLQSDNSFPVFDSLLIGLTQLNDSTYIACRSSIINISGNVKDNLKLNRVGFSMNNGKENLSVNSTDSLDLATLFGNQVNIPPDTQDSTIINLHIIAVDTFENRSVKTFKILVDCDDQSPKIEVIKSNPKLNSFNRVFVTQGGKLKIPELKIEDNRFISEASVYYNLQAEPLSLFGSTNINSSDPVNLNDFINLEFDVPLSAPIGEVREVSIMAKDSIGNESEITKIIINVIEDEPPLIIITDTYISNSAVAFNDTGYTPIKPGDFVTFDGKVEELNFLKSLKIYWSEESSVEAPLVNEVNFLQLPINLSEYHNLFSFVVPDNASLGTKFKLEIVPTDSKNQETKKVYLFEVSN
ncbi:hypothetical protein [Flexithrix dorotheae]|uniref:hypothetical protein n=1 Tax=Flexithrix dorotheae TaxID=70993 RepID=UPI00036B12E2|nr:hypothetical protein [Flexithrix dorotheae]